MDFPDKLAVQAQLENRATLRFPRQLCIDNFIRPVSESTGNGHAKKNVRTAAPNATLQVCLRYDLGAGSHRAFRLARSTIGAIHRSTGYVIPEILKMSQVRGFVLKPSFLENGDCRIMPMRFIDLPAYS